MYELAKLYRINPSSSFWETRDCVGTRIAVDLILEKLSLGDTVEQIIEAYPTLSKEQILACLSFAADQIRNEVILRNAS